MFKALSELSIRHGKVMLAVWLVIVLMLIPPAIKTVESMDSTFSGIDSDYVKEKEAVSKYFDPAEFDLSNMTVIVVDYDTHEGYRQLSGIPSISIPPFTEYLENAFDNNTKWEGKLNDLRGRTSVMKTSGDSNSGMILIGFNFTDNFSDYDRRNATPELRSDVHKIVDDYMYELYEKDRCFNVYLTGNNAIVYDSEVNLDGFAGIASIAVVIIVLLLTGIVFGSAMTSFIPATSMTVSAIVTAAIYYSIKNISNIPMTVTLTSILIIVILCFAHSILLIATYRREMIKGRTFEESLRFAIQKSNRIILATSLCMLVCCVMMMFSEMLIMVALGKCLSIGVCVVTVVSFTVTPSLMSITKNESFWERLFNKGSRTKAANKTRDVLSEITHKLLDKSKNINTKYPIAIIIAILAIAAGCCAYMYVSDPYSKSSGDVLSDTAVDESAEGMKVLQNRAEGGIFNPYEISIGFGQSIGTIARDYDLGGNEYYTLVWNSGDAINEINELARDLRECDPENIQFVSAPIVWNDLVLDAYAHSCTTPEEVLDYIQNYLDENNWLASQVMKDEIAKLSITYLPFEIILFGPMIDFDVNHHLGMIGYEMTSDKNIVVNHLKIIAYTKESPTSSKSMNTTDAIEKTITNYEYSSALINSHLIIGNPILFKNLMTGMEKINVPSLIICMLAVILIIGLAQMCASSTLTTITTMLIGMLISDGIISVLMDVFWGGGSVLVVELMSFGYVTISLWFGHMQIYMRKRFNDELVMTKLFNHIILITSGTIVLASAMFIFSGIRLVSQIGTALVIMVLVETVIIRLFLSPCMLSVFDVLVEKMKEHAKDDEPEA